MENKLPKNFTKYASSPTLEGITKLVNEFYCSDSYSLIPAEEPGHYRIQRGDGKLLFSLVVETKKGFYFGY